jgi:hypothetical protein
MPMPRIRVMNAHRFRIRESTPYALEMPCTQPRCRTNQAFHSAFVSLVNGGRRLVDRRCGGVNESE